METLVAPPERLDAGVAISFASQKTSQAGNAANEVPTRVGLEAATILAATVLLDVMCDLSNPKQIKITSIKRIKSTRKRTIRSNCQQHESRS